MSATQVCRQLMLTVRSTRRHSGSGSRMRQMGCIHRAPTQRRAYSLDSLSSGPGRPPGQQARGEKVSPSIGLTQRNLSALSLAVQHRPMCRYEFLDLGEVEENTLKAESSKLRRRFIIDPAIAEVVTRHLGPDLEDSKAAIFECNPGPGVLTRTLLNAGAQRVVALESDKTFLPELRDLESRLDGQLDVVHCDYFKLDPMKVGSMKPPVMLTDKLFTDLGISEASWTDDVPVKVVGVIPQTRERNRLWKILYTLFDRASVYRYGRVELNLFISEKEYLQMVAKAGIPRSYTAFGVLWQMACDIKLLHMEPWSSFMAVPNNLPIQKYKFFPNDHLCLVRLTPKKDLFSAHLTPFNGSTMIMMVKQFMASRTLPLIERLNSWSPDSGADLLKELGLPQDILTGCVRPKEYRQLFDLMEQSPEFSQSWFYQDLLENSYNMVAYV